MFLSKHFDHQLIDSIIPLDYAALLECPSFFYKLLICEENWGYLQVNILVTQPFPQPSIRCRGTNRKEKCQRDKTIRLVVVWHLDKHSVHSLLSQYIFYLQR